MHFTWDCAVRAGSRGLASTPTHGVYGDGGYAVATAHGPWCRLTTRMPTCLASCPISTSRRSASVSRRVATQGSAIGRQATCSGPDRTTICRSRGGSSDGITALALAGRSRSPTSSASVSATNGGGRGAAALIGETASIATTATQKRASISITATVTSGAAARYAAVFSANGFLRPTTAM